METLHHCKKNRCELTWNPHGVAVDFCKEDGDGKLWAGNREYENRVNYCPFCGYEAKNKDPFVNKCED